MNETQEAPATGDGGTGRRWKAVFTIVEGRGDKKYWPRIGAAFENRDGSWNIKLDALPINGVLHMRDAEPIEARAERSQGGSGRRDSGRDPGRESMYATQGVL